MSAMVESSNQRRVSPAITGRRAYTMALPTAGKLQGSSSRCRQLLLTTEEVHLERGDSEGPLCQLE